MLRSWSRKESKLLAGAGARAVFEVPFPAPDSGQTRVVYFIIIHLEQDQASDLNRYYFQKIMKTLHFN